MSENYQPITGYAAADVGPREVLEDYSVVDDVVTASGLYLKVGIVCDGVGGVKSGERAAFMTANTTLEVMRSSYDTIVPRMIVDAIKEANRRVYYDDTSGKSTIAMYVIHFDGQSPYGRLYLASVGDSNVFMIREGSLKRLNTDHNVANEMVLNGQATPEQAYALDNAYHITRAIGVGPDIEVDIGFYYNASGREQAHQRGKAGIIVEPGDTFFSCSDGLTDAGADGLPYVREEEFLEHALDLDPQRAAKLYLSYALRRGTHDNVSIALMFVESEARYASDDGSVTHVIGMRTRNVIIGGVILLILATAAIFGLYTILGGRISEKDQQVKEAVSVIEAAQATDAYETAIAETIAAYTPTPSPTLTPTPTALPPLAVGEVGFLFTSRESEPSRVQESQMVNAGANPVYVSAGNISPGHFAYFYLMPSSSGLFFDVSEDKINFFLQNNGEVFIQTQGYLRGAEIEVEAAPSARFYVRGSCLAIQHQEPNITAACYDGTCEFLLSRSGNTERLERGQQITYKVTDSGLEFVDQRGIDIFEAERYDGIIKGFNPPDSVIGNSCAGEYIPTPTPTPTNTSRPRPTNSPQATTVQDRDIDGVPDGVDACPDQHGPSSNNGCPTSNNNNPPPTNAPPPTQAPPTRTPISVKPTSLPSNTPQPSNTPVPPTNTPQPSNTPVPPTNTPQPSNTPVPPSNTPQPTNTPVPPSNTPEPPPPSNTPEPPPDDGEVSPEPPPGEGGETPENTEPFLPL